MQRIIIKNFGPIPNCCIDLKDFMIFIENRPLVKALYVKAFITANLLRTK